MCRAMLLRTRAPAKINLTLHVVRRRPDGYHDLESLVAFAGVADILELVPDEPLGLAVRGSHGGRRRAISTTTSCSGPRAP